MHTDRREKTKYNTQAVAEILRTGKKVQNNKLMLIIGLAQLGLVEYDVRAAEGDFVRAGVDEADLEAHQRPDDDGDRDPVDGVVSEGALFAVPDELQLSVDDQVRRPLEVGRRRCLLGDLEVENFRVRRRCRLQGDKHALVHHLGTDIAAGGGVLGDLDGQLKAYRVMIIIVASYHGRPLHRKPDVRWLEDDGHGYHHHRGGQDPAERCQHDDMPLPVPVAR